MMRIVTFFGILGLFLGLELANASFFDRVTIKGTVFSLEDKIVTLETEVGKVKIPRKSFREPASLVPGRVVSVRVSLPEVVHLNQKREKKKFKFTR